ncbi:hypothetical protein PN36_30935 [Candidatus Thiomargarita nelsonii]|uniref:DUF4351 domain-containing protein n=1 Tax=Candidatus Thiomargarita nelsonii TaxID=1003181 RepID=A0A0A6RQ93_9GAMM|nr:hypothetical protein PN36_30935 [Candidatus Thiomargarita nelsonii]
MTSSHEPFDDSTKTFYRKFFEDCGMVVETEREVFFRGRKIDLVVTCTDNNKLQNTVFSHFRQINAIELKGIHDPLTVIDYNRIMMRAWGLGALKEESEENDELGENTDTDDAPSDDNQLSPLPSKRTLTIVCVTKPIKILKQLKDEFKFFKIDEGIYYCEDRLPQWIICPSELALVEKNYPLLPLARGEKLKQFTSLCFREGLTDYLRLIMDIGLYTDPNVILQKILEVTQMKVKIRDDTRLCLDHFFRDMPEEMWKLPTFKEVMAENQSLWELRGVRQGVQKTLIRQLRHKFAPIPDSVVQKIEATYDLAQLDNWLDQVIAADSLANTGLVSH